MRAQANLQGFLRPVLTVVVASSCVFIPQTAIAAVVVIAVKFIGVVRGILIKLHRAAGA